MFETRPQLRFDGVSGHDDSDRSLVRKLCRRTALEEKRGCTHIGDTSSSLRTDGSCFTKLCQPSDLTSFTGAVDIIDDAPRGYIFISGWFTFD